MYRTVKLNSVVDSEDIRIYKSQQFNTQHMPICLNIGHCTDTKGQDYGANVVFKDVIESVKDLVAINLN